MSVDLLGPANAQNAVTVRPAETRVFGAADTFFKDCTSPGAKDGTKLMAAYLNSVLQQVRRAIRGMGITEDNTDDDMLLKAIQRAETLTAIPKITRSILTTPGAFSFTVPAGVFRVKQKLWGAGGGGGWGDVGGGASGGGAGAYLEKTLDVNPGDIITGVIGLAGTAGVAGLNGTAGGNTTAVYGGVTYTAGGGLGGINASGGVTQNSVDGGHPINGDPPSRPGQPSFGGVLGGGVVYGGQGGLSPDGGFGGQAGSGNANPGDPRGGGGGGGANGFLAGHGGNGEAWFEYAAP